MHFSSAFPSPCALGTYFVCNCIVDDDLVDVMIEVADIVSHWKTFALVLGVKKPSLEEIERKCPGMLMYVHKRAQQLSGVCVVSYKYSNHRTYLPVSLLVLQTHNYSICS